MGQVRIENNHIARLRFQRKPGDFFAKLRFDRSMIFPSHDIRKHSICPFELIGKCLLPVSRNLEASVFKCGWIDADHDSHMLFWSKWLVSGEVLMRREG